MQNILVNHYRGVFQKIFLWSPTSRLDGSWAPVFEYMRRVLGQDTESIDPKEQCVFDTFNPEDLSRIVARQTEIVKKRKEIKSGRSVEMPSICLVVDDFADDPAVMRRSGFVTAFLRLRHQYISCALLSQRWRLLDPTARVNLTGILVFRLRDVDELDQVVRSLGAKYGYKQTREIYDACTSEPYSFMYYNALTNTFYCRFEHKVEIEEEES